MLYCYIDNNNVTNVGGLPTSWGNISNFHSLNNEELKVHNWFPVITISENKGVQVKVEYVIESDVVKEIVTTREKTQEEIDAENKNN